MWAPQAVKVGGPLGSPQPDRSISLINLKHLTLHKYSRQIPQMQENDKFQ